MNINVLKDELQEKGFIVNIEDANTLRISKDPKDILKYSIMYKYDVNKMTISMIHEDIDMNEAEEIFGYYSRVCAEINNILSKRKPYIVKIDLSIASEEEINNIIACILNEDTTETEYNGSRIIFTNLKNNPRNFYDLSDRSFKVICNEDNNTIVDIVMNSEQTREFKNDIKRQIKEIRGGEY